MTPAGLMTGLPLPAPFTNAFREAMERLSDGPLAPALDLFMTTEGVVAKAALPGVKPDDVDITIGDDLVTISGFVEDESETTKGGYVHRELGHGSFRRSFWLPTEVRAEAATASLRDGLLTLTIPKTEQAKPNQNVKVVVP
jgi:HSP20 family protein